MNHPRSVVIGLLALLSMSTLAPAQAAPESGVACVVDMPIPAYSGVYWIARVTGEAGAKITVGAGGVPTAVEVESTQRALVVWLKSALLKSTFLEHCAGQTVEIRFVYRLAGSEDNDPHNEVRLKGPGSFEVVARPPIRHIEP
jgi:hypothetical protein